MYFFFLLTDFSASLFMFEIKALCGKKLRTLEQQHNEENNQLSQQIVCKHRFFFSFIQSQLNKFPIVYFLF
jgi:integral membrane sensor domain MASE1